MNETEYIDDVVADSSPAFPWPPAEGESIPGAFARTWRGACLEPRRFYAALPDGITGAALLYYIAIGVALAGVSLFWRSLFGALLPSDGMFAGLGGSSWSPIIEFLLSPVVLLLSIVLSSGVTHGLLLLFGGAPRGYVATLTVFAFAYSPQLLGIVPVLGQIAGFFWMVFGAIIGLSVVHRSTTLRAAAAVLLPLCVVLFLFVAAVMIAGLAGMSGLTP